MSMSSKYFSDRECQCRCGECDVTVNADMLTAADKIRRGWQNRYPDEPRIDCVSGGRCHNYTMYLRMHGIPAALGSAHITGQAMDLKPRNGKYMEFHDYCVGRLDELDLYMEDPIYTGTWAHLQKRKTKSGKRVFSI